MKRGVFAVTMAATAAGVASALAFAPASQSLPRPAVAGKPPVEAANPVIAVQATPVKTALEVRQAPVPVLMKARPPVDLPGVEARAPEPQPAAAAEATGESKAKAAVEADGYKAVKVLRKGANGLWYVEALRGSTRVLLTVDAQGNVAAE